MKLGFFTATRPVAGYPLGRWCIFVALAIIAWTHTAFMATLFAGFWWAWQKAYCPRFTPAISVMVFGMPTVIGAIAAMRSRSSFLASVPLIQWFECWAVVLIACGLVVGYASTATWLIPYC